MMDPSAPPFSPSAAVPGNMQLWSPDLEKQKRETEEATTLARANFARAVEYLKVETNYLASLKDMITASKPIPYMGNKPYVTSPKEVSEAIRNVMSRLGDVAQASGTYLR